MGKDDFKILDDVEYALKIMNFLNSQNRSHVPLSSFFASKPRPTFTFMYPPATDGTPKGESDSDGEPGRKFRSLISEEQPITLEKFQILEKVYFKTRFISPLKAKELATETNLTQTQIHNWFEIRQSEWRKTEGVVDDLFPRKVYEKSHYFPSGGYGSKPSLSSLFYNSMCAVVAVEFLLNGPNHPVYFRARFPSTTEDSEITMNAFKKAKKQLSLRAVSSFDWQAVLDHDTIVAVNAEHQRVFKSRTMYFLTQLLGLELKFQSADHLATSDQETLAVQVGLSKLYVKLWFENRREIEKENRLKAEDEETDQENSSVKSFGSSSSKSSDSFGDTSETLSTMSDDLELSVIEENDKPETCGLLKLFSQFSNYVKTKLTRTARNIVRRA